MDSVIDGRYQVGTDVFFQVRSDVTAARRTKCGQRASRLAEGVWYVLPVTPRKPESIALEIEAV